MIDWITDPYRTEFMQRAAVMALLVGVLAPVVGVWVVLRRVAYLGDAMSHGSLAGVAGAYAAGISITVGALVAGLVMGVLEHEAPALRAEVQRVFENVDNVPLRAIFEGRMLETDLARDRLGRIRAVDDVLLHLGAPVAPEITADRAGKGGRGVGGTR